MRTTPGTVKLADFAGQIVVLDFFAYWCAPCLPASKEIESGIGRHYLARKGNRYGVPVRALAVNIERDHPERTAQFIKEAGLETVLNDFEGKLLAQLGGAATPFVVIIDGTRATASDPVFQVAYQSDGFEGTRKLRQVIDGLRPHGDSTPAPEQLTSLESGSGAPLVKTAEAAFEALLASDIQITSSTLTYGQKTRGTDWKLNLTYRSIDEDYEPYRRFDFLGYSEHLRDDYVGGQASIRQNWDGPVTLLASAGGYDGYQDFRSLWRANYYRQQVGFLPQYSEPDPRGFNASGGLRWEYQPTTGFLEAGFLYANDTVAPGWESPPNVRSSREFLHTYSPSLKFENVLTERIRTLNEAQLTLLSARQPRYSFRSSFNVALAERWVWRTAGGYTHENPTLRAWSISTTLEYELTPRWLLSASGAYYHDTGEIENSIAISAAAPGLESWQGGLGIRYVGRRTSANLSVAPVSANYDAVELGTRPFTHLYKDRLWVSVQAAWNFQF